MATKSGTRSFTSILRMLLFTVLLVAVSIAGTLFLQNYLQLNPAKAHNTDEHTTVNISEPLFTSLEPFTVSLRDSHGNRVLYVGITLRVENEASRQMISIFMPEVRDRVLATLTQQSTSHVHAPAGRESLASQLQHELTKPYHPYPEGPRITRVLFTAYVVQ